MNTSSPAKLTSSRLPGFDGLRAVSILLVICSHLALRCPDSIFRYCKSFDSGNLGVRVFFVISGFLITSLLLRELGKDGRINLLRFYFRRSFRIMPPFYFYLMLVASLRLFGFEEPSARHLLVASTYSANYLGTTWLTAHSWSLAVEEQFYCIWPGILVLFGIRTSFRVALAFLFLSPLLRSLIHVLPWWPSNPRYAFETVGDALATGCLLAHFRDKLWNLPAYQRFLSSPYFSIWPLAILGLSYLRTRYPIFGDPIGITLINVTIAVFLDHQLRFSGSILGKFFNWKPVATLGVLSYSMYLWQQPFLSEHFPIHPYATLPLILLCAALSYRFIEQPALKLRDTLERRFSK